MIWSGARATIDGHHQPDHRRELGRGDHAEHVDDRQAAEQPAPPAAPHDQRDRDRQADDGKVGDGGGQPEQGAPASFDRSLVASGGA